jgi:hypothetical protein
MKMPASTLRLTTPEHQTEYSSTGTGCAGNHHKPAAPSPTTTPAHLASTSRPPKAFKPSHGGPDTITHFSERAIFSFDEELEQLAHADDTIAPVYHLGRGGAGNTVHAYAEAHERRQERGMCNWGKDAKERGVGG